MKSHKKLCIIGILAIIVLVVAILYMPVKNKLHKLELDKIKPVIVYNWNGLDTQYVIAESDGEVSYSVVDCSSGIQDSTKTLEDFERENDDCLGGFTYRYLNYEDEGILFFNDNNYYVIYPVVGIEEKVFTVQNMYSSVNINNIMYVPTIMDISVDKETVDMFKEDFNRNYLDYYFDNFTFEQTKEFYLRMDDEFYSVDEENQTISVRGYAIKKHEYVENAMTFDFVNRTITGRDYDGTVELYDGE